MKRKVTNKNIIPVMVRLDEQTVRALSKYSNSLTITNGAAARYILTESLRNLNKPENKLAGIIWTSTDLLNM